MKLQRSHSCRSSQLKDKSKRKQPIQNRRLSLSNIKKRTREQPNQSMKHFKQKILSYIDKRSDVEIINFYQQYKEQFLRRSFNLQNLLYEQPQLRQKYLSQQNQHFFKGFQHTLLTLFRKRIIVPAEFKNMRQQTVEEIQKWVFSWVKRKKAYENAIKDQEKQIQQVQTLVQDIRDWGRSTKEQKMMF